MISGGGKEGAFTVYPYPDGELVYHCRLYAIGFLQPKGQTATFSNLRISEDTWNTLLYNPAETYVEKGEGKLNVWYPGENVSAPMLRKAIKIEKPVKSAVYMLPLGCLRVLGERAEGWKGLSESGLDGLPLPYHV